MKKAKCIIHFTNYLMEDTTRTNTCPWTNSMLGFSWWPSGREAELPSFPLHQQETRPGSKRWPCDTENMLLELQLCAKRIVLLLLRCCRWQEDWDTWSLMNSHSRLIFWRKGDNCKAAEPLFSGWGCVCESCSAVINKVKLSTANNILVKHS